MATYEYKTVTVSSSGDLTYNATTKTWDEIETYLDVLGALSWEVVATIPTADPRTRQLILMKTTT